MFELIFRQLFTAQWRPTVVEIITRLEKRMDRNEKIELFLQKRAELFPRDPRGCVRFILYFGIVYGYLLAKENNTEVEDLFKVTDISDEAAKKLQ